MAAPHYDLFVIGAGSGGVRAARFAASFGAKVGIAEARHFGGTCVHLGCVPKKLLVYGSEYAHALREARGFGWDVTVHGHSWTKLRDAKDLEIARLGGIYRKLLEQAGVGVHEGFARLEDAHTVVVGAERITAERILIATGSRALRADIPGAELGITSDEAFHLEALPARIAILGAGFIALEFAGIFRGLGVEVHQVHRGPELLRRFDRDVREHLRQELTKQGIHLHLGAQVEKLERVGSAVHVQISGRPPLEVDMVMHALGRAPNTRELGLEQLGVTSRQNGALVVDSAYRTNVPSVLAIGDVLDHVQLTPVALAEGMWVARKYFGGLDPAPIDYRLVPSAVFSQPSVGTVGLTEDEARLEHDVVVFRTTFKPMRHTLSGRDEKTMMKLVVDRVTDRVLGVHVVGPDAGEIIQGFAVALTCGATKAQLDATIGIHPTAAEELVTLRTPVG